MTPRVFLVAGEVSGDIYGADLAAALRRLRPDVELVGVGGPRMAAAGVRCLADSAEWGLIGWVDILPRLPQMLARLVRVRRAITRLAPAVLVLIDFPGFNLALAERLGGRFPVAYFLPPMVSIRRGERARRIARLGMRLLAVFPFEADAYRAAHADVTFIGHPAVDRLRPSGTPEEIRRRLNLPVEGPLLALLPGSRRRELRRHLPVIVRALAAVRARVPGVRAVLPVATPAQRALAEDAMRAAAVPIALMEGGGQAGYDALAAADFAVITSGTATLEALLVGVPGVVIYRASRVDFWIARRIVRVGWAGLPSLLAGREVMPELLQHELTPRHLGAVIVEWLGDPGRRARLREDLLALRDRLGPPGAVERAAMEILRLARLLGSEPSSTIQKT